MSDNLRWSFDLRYQPIGQPTGRPAFPSFALRSAGQVATHDEYVAKWDSTRRLLLDRVFDQPLYEQSRWLANKDDPVCA